MCEMLDMREGPLCFLPVRGPLSTTFHHQICNRPRCRVMSTELRGWPPFLFPLFLQALAQTLVAPGVQLLDQAAVLRNSCSALPATSGVLCSGARPRKVCPQQCLVELACDPFAGWYRSGEHRFA